MEECEASDWAGLILGPLAGKSFVFAAPVNGCHTIPDRMFGYEN